MYRMLSLSQREILIIWFFDTFENVAFSLHLKVVEDKKSYRVKRRPLLNLLINVVRVFVIFVINGINANSIKKRIPAKYPTYKIYYNN